MDDPDPTVFQFTYCMDQIDPAFDEVLRQVDEYEKLKRKVAFLSEPRIKRMTWCWEKGGKKNKKIKSVTIYLMNTEGRRSTVEIDIPDPDTENVGYIDFETLETDVPTNCGGEQHNLGQFY